MNEWVEMMPVGKGEVVIVGKLLAGEVPTSFSWRGRKHRVRSIEIRQQRARAGWKDVVKRDFYNVRTAEGLRCRLSRGKLRGDWRMEKLLLAGGR